MSVALKFVKAYFNLSSRVAPESAAKRSFRVFQKVRIKSIRDREVEFFDKAKKFVVPGKYENIDCFEFGDPTGQLTILVHGWESNAGSMSKLAFKFADLGHRVVAFNLPGHAQYKKSSTNLLECFTSMMELLDHLNPTDPINVVSHSLGSAVTANALARSRYKVNRLVFLTSPRVIQEIFFDFKKMISLSDKAYKSLLDLTENLLGEPLSNLDVDFNLNKVDYDELLLIHDKNDRIIPFINSETIEVNTLNSSLIPLEKKGHYKMLWSADVIEQAVSFIAEAELTV